MNSLLFNPMGLYNEQNHCSQPDGVGLYGIEEIGMEVSSIVLIVWMVL